MKKKSTAKKLVLAKETLQNMELHNVKGGLTYQLACAGSSYCLSGEFANCPEH